MKNPAIILYFLLAWSVLAILLFFFYQFNRNVELKRSLHPWIVSGISFLFWLFLLYLGFPNRIIYLSLLGLALAAFLNIRLTRFCGNCGRTIFNRGFLKAKFCPNCGNCMEEKPDLDTNSGK
jgi:ribosomal protein S27AE